MTDEKVRIMELCRIYRHLDKGQHCFYCGAPTLQKHEKSRDHVIPRSAGGINTKKNILNSCHPCNHSKGSLSYEEFRTKRYCGREIEFYGETIVRQWRDKKRKVYCIANRPMPCKPNAVPIDPLNDWDWLEPFTP